MGKKLAFFLLGSFYFFWFHQKLGAILFTPVPIKRLSGRTGKKMLCFISYSSILRRHFISSTIVRHRLIFSSGKSSYFF
jgi:hypothetical protein